MKSKSICAVYYVALALIASCNKEEIINRPVFQMTSVDYNKDGAQLEGKIGQVNSSYSAAFGFSWGTDPRPTGNQFTFDQQETEGSFTQIIDFRWELNTTYFVRFFMKGTGGIIYSDPIVFTTPQNWPLEITGFSPKSGTTDTDITITGRFLDQEPINRIFLSIGNYACYATTVSSTSVTVRIPAVNLSGYFPVLFWEGNRSVDLGETFFLIGPFVSAFNPTSGPAGTTVVVSGSGFSPIPANNLLYLTDGSNNESVATVTASTDTQLTIVIPSGLTFSACSLRLVVNGITTYPHAQFTVTP